MNINYHRKVLLNSFHLNTKLQDFIQTQYLKAHRLAFSFQCFFFSQQVDIKDGKLRLTPLQTFAIETRDLLRHLDGCVSLNRFAPNFQQLYGRPCKAADYGFNRISEVIDVMSNVAEIHGKGAEKMVVLVDGDNIAVTGVSGHEGEMICQFF